MERVGNFDRASSGLSGANGRKSCRVENPITPLRTPYAAFYVVA